MSTTVYLKERTNKENTRINFYLEFYKGYIKTDTGIKNIRTKQTLKGLYKYVKPKNHIERQHNKEHQLKADNTLRITRADIIQGNYSFKSNISDKLFTEQFKSYCNNRNVKSNSLLGWRSVEKHLINFIQSKWNVDTYRVSDIDIEFVEGFIKYLNNDATTRKDEPLSNNTKHLYYGLFKSFMADMVRKKIIKENYCSGIKAFSLKDVKREYLTFDELKKMGASECNNKELKRAFLFSCYTGLRWSDIQKLIWKEVIDETENSRIIFTQKKTEGVSYLNLTVQVRSLLGSRQPNEYKVFPNLKYNSYTSPVLQRWALRAGVYKEITFHCARHTFATLQITYGTDLFTVSKLLGHKNISTTEIYAKIVDKKKEDAMNVIPVIEIN